MKPSHVRLTTARIVQSVLCGMIFASAQYTVLLPGNPLIARAQATSKPSPQSKSQKIANPLNDLLDEAQRDIDKKEFAAAIAPLQKIIADQPEFAYAHFQLAYAYTALKKTDEARAEYERTVSLDPKMSEACLNLGILLLDNEPRAAIAPLNQAVVLLPSQSRPRFLLGVAQERSGDLAKAANSFEGAL